MTTNDAEPQVTLHVPASDLPPSFTPSDTHIRAGLVDIGQQPRLDPALRERIAKIIYETMFPAALWEPDSTGGLHCEDAAALIMALIDSIAPAAQPLPTRSELWDLMLPILNPTASVTINITIGVLIDKMQEAGYAREDDPEPKE